MMFKMHDNFLRPTIAALILVPLATLSSGCSVSDALRQGTPVAEYARTDQRLPSASGWGDAKVFVAEYTATADNILGYRTTGGAPLVSLTVSGYPAGIAFDQSSNLYVATVEGPIYVFAPGATSSFETFTSLNFPAAIAIDNMSHVWVPGNVSGGTNIEEFSTQGKLLQTIQCQQISQQMDQVSVDASGDVFINGYGYPNKGSRVVEIAAGKTTCSKLPREGGLYEQVGGLATTSTGALVNGDFDDSYAFTFAPPAFKKVVGRTQFDNLSQPTAFALTPDNKNIWVGTETDQDESNGPAAVMFRYPNPRAKKALAAIGLSYTPSSIAIAP